MSEISGPQTGNSYDKVRGHKDIGGDVSVQLKPGTIGKDLEGFHSRLDKSAPGAAEVLNPPLPTPIHFENAVMTINTFVSAAAEAENTFRCVQELESFACVAEMSSWDTLVTFSHIDLILTEN